jgi:hypothetical protein
MAIHDKNGGLIRFEWGQLAGTPTHTEKRNPSPRAAYL